MFRLCCRVKGVTANQEESLLQQLTEITRVMQEGKLVEGISPEKTMQESWEGKPTLHTATGALHVICKLF